MMNYLFTRPYDECAIYFKSYSYKVAGILQSAGLVREQLLIHFDGCDFPKVLVPTSNPAYFLAGIIGCWQSQCVAIPKREDKREPTEIDYSYACPDGEILFDQEGNCSVQRFLEGVTFSNNYIGDVILTTTGSTGKPKGVVLTLNQLILNAFLSGNVIGLYKLNGWAIETDLALTSGFCHLLMAWVMGVPLTYLRDVSTAEKKLYFSQEGVGYGGSPIQAIRLADEIAANNAPQSIMTSGDFFTKPMFERVRKKFPYVNIHKCYGLTELSGRFCIMPNKLLADNPSAVGYPLPGFEIQILDDNGGPCENNFLGNIYVRSPLLMQGYLIDNEFALINATDWFPTNDQGMRDDNNLVYLHGRVNDCFKVGGEKVDRFTIEKELSGLLSEFDYCVLPTPHNILGYVPVLYIAEHSQLPPPDWRTILTYLNNKLPSRFMPMEGKLLDHMPRMENGKLDRKKIVRNEAVDLKW